MSKNFFIISVILSELKVKSSFGLNPNFIPNLAELELPKIIQLSH